MVNHPEIALTLEKCLIQGKILFAFVKLSAFLWIMQFFLISSSYIAHRFYKSNEGEPMDGNLK